ncbi:holo-ACP synthase [Campylobacter sp. FMV-PI01]|uniref:Holo-ACP synthase n=1 Tax=Campylobacter portucalensis TaxID=2608384 RepID=A0A6L5WHM2_9BACT|nr:holo-ACP synthase [Campylobacter portucalensis]MSN96680.1 holo-ACP synthase [Campylobacter portucalensis]
MIGIDIVSVSRISKLKAKFGTKFLKKFLNQNEINLVKSDESLAGFYAAKEAVSKALKTGISGEFSFLDVEIYKDTKNAPNLKFKDEIVRKFNIKKSDLSISHDGGFAIAAVIIN